MSSVRQPKCFGADVLGVFLVLAATPGPLKASELSSTLNRKDLLISVYPLAREQIQASNDRLKPLKLVGIDLPDVQWPWLPRPGRNTTSDTPSTTVEITPIEVIRLDDQHAVMITETLPLDTVRGETICSSYGCLYAIGAYFFTQVNAGQWRLSKSIEVAGSAYPGITEPHVLRWPGHGYLLSGSDNFFAQGAGTNSVILMDLEPDQVTFFDEIPISEENQESMGFDCIDILNPKYRVDPNANYTTVLDCRRGLGRWRIFEDGIRVNYEIFARKSSETSELLPLQHIFETVILKPKNGRLEAVSGQLPEFGF